jgi:hypothetical protein
MNRAARPPAVIVIRESRRNGTSTSNPTDPAQQRLRSAYRFSESSLQSWIVGENRTCNSQSQSLECKKPHPPPKTKTASRSLPSLKAKKFMRLR